MASRSLVRRLGGHRLGSCNASFRGFGERSLPVQLVAPDAWRDCRRGFARRLDGYLHYYGKLKNQEGMLRDHARVDGYRKGLMAAESRIKGAVVMDIGTGSGILAMTAAQLGAKKVYAVEASPDVARLASRLARANGYMDVIEVIPKHLEDITDEDVAPGSVDVIVSEIFSHFLVGEMGLQPVTRAKQRFLRDGGLVLPAMSWLKLSPFEDKEIGAELRARHSFWNQRDFHGFDITAALPLAVEQSLRENIADIVDPASLLVPPAESPKHVLDLASPTDPEVWRSIKFDVSFPDRSRDAVIDGICGWFDLEFSGEGVSDPAPILSTSPDAPPTVWAQNRFLLKHPIPAAKEDKLWVSCQLKMNAVRESYTLRLELHNDTTKVKASAGPIELSNIYARHFASSIPFPKPGSDGTAAPPTRSSMALT